MRASYQQQPESATRFAGFKISCLQPLGQPGATQ